MSNLNTHDVTDYESALRFLDGRKQAVLCYATTLMYDPDVLSGGVVTVYHHNTAIIRYYADGSIEIRTAGYLTTTTVGRLHNMTPPEVRVSRAKGGSVQAPVLSADFVPADWVEVVPAVEYAR